MFFVFKLYCVYDIFSELRSKCRFLTKIDYNRYITNIQNDLISSPNYFWRFLKSKRSNHLIPLSMYYQKECQLS